MNNTSASASMKPTRICHVVAVPYPGRGHINPMMNLCKVVASKAPYIIITFVVTEEWLGFIGSDAKPKNIRFGSIPNVIPSELVRGADFPGFYEAVMTTMEAPFDQLLDQREPPATTIIADTELVWAVRIGNCRNIPVAMLCTISATVFSMLQRFDSIGAQHCSVDLLEHEDKLVDNISGISSTDFADFLTIFDGTSRRVMELTLECVSWVKKAQYFLFTSVYELEAQVFDTLKGKFPFPVYPIGPAIPYFDSKENSCTTTTPNDLNYLQWLDHQPAGSVLYISLGSFLSISSDQMDQIAGGLQHSSVRYLWVARGESSRLKNSGDDMGLVVPWCNQLKVLCHSSVGGFWTHCGWNSTLEAVFAGVPMLTFPIFFDQVPNSKRIVEDWKIGWRVRERVGDENSVTREEISELVKRFMDQESIEVQSMRKRATDLSEICNGAVVKGGSSDTNLDAFLNDISQGNSSK